MNLESLRARQAAQPDSLWWTHRLLAALLSLRCREGREDHAGEAIDCFLRIAAADPDWALEAITERSPQGQYLIGMLSGDRLEEVLAAVQIPDAKSNAVFRAALLCDSASLSEDNADLTPWRRAWDELTRVDLAARDTQWRRYALHSAARVAYPEYRELAIEHLASLDRDFWRSVFLPGALDAAARHRDWPTFDRWLEAWHALPGPLRRGHKECQVIALQGHRAILEDNLPAAEAALRKLIEAAQGAEFLSNEEIAGFPKRLRAEGKLLDLCDTFDAIVQRKDWRLLER